MKIKTLLTLIFTLFLTQSIQSQTTLRSESYIVIDRNTQEPLKSLNADKIIHPASLTKIMTTLVALEQLSDEDLNKYYELSDEIFLGLKEQNASLAGFDPYDSVKIIDILYGIMLPSGADAARAIAFYIAGSEEDFVSLMNDKAHSLSLKNTHFTNTSGLDDDSHLSTVSDIAIILEAALNNEIFTEIYTSIHYETSPTHYYQNGIQYTNKSLEFSKQKDTKFTTPILYGAKSGYTELSGSSLSSIGTYKGNDYMIISSGAPYSTSEYYNVQDALNLYYEVIESITNDIPTKPEVIHSSVILYLWPFTLILALLVISIYILNGKRIKKHSNK